MTKSKQSDKKRLCNCPRCGTDKVSEVDSDPLLSHLEGYYVMCDQCGTVGTVWETEEFAILAWNLSDVNGNLSERNSKKLLNEWLTQHGMATTIQEQVREVLDNLKYEKV